MTLAGIIRPRWLSGILADVVGAAAKPGDVYGLPGQGRSVGISVITAILMLVTWWYVTHAGMIKPLFLPGPEAVLGALLAVSQEEFAGATLLDHTAASLYRVFVALFFAVVTAIPIGIAMGVNTVARAIFDPIIEFYRPIPPLAYLPLLIIWLGIDDAPKIVLSFAVIFPPLVISARAGVRSVSIEQIHAAYSVGATRRQVLWHVVVRGALPDMLTGLRIGIGFGWQSLVAAEIVAARRGLGHMVLSASEFLVTDVVIMGIMVIGVLAVGFDLLMRWIERVVVPWKGKM